MPPQRSTRPTLKTISELSGFAVPTVSRALKGAPDIGKSTRETVQRIASEIGYVPNRAGVRLKTGKTNVISLVLSTEHDMMNQTARLISSLAGALRDTNYHMIVTPYFPDEDPMKPVQYIVETGSADAVVINQTQPEDPRVAYLMERQFPFATYGRTNWSHQHPYFDFDNTEFSRCAVRDFVARGRKNLVLVAPPRNQFYSRCMIEGAQSEAKRAGLNFALLENVTSDDPADKIHAAIKKYLTDFPETDAILCGRPSGAMAAVTALEDQGRTLGEDIDVFGKEAIEFLRLFRPGVLSVMEDVSRAGTFLARAAIQAINQPDLPPMQELDIPRKPRGTS